MLARLLGKLLLVAVCFIQVSAISLQTNGKHITGRATYLHDKIVNWGRNRGVVIVDGDNVRGKTKFSVSKEKLCNDIAQWSKDVNMQGRVCVVFDHAQQHEAFFLEDSGLSILFSGPRKSADDVISRDIGWIQGNLRRDVMVITEDLLLRRRCRTSSQGSRISKKKSKKSHKKKLLLQDNSGSIETNGEPVLSKSLVVSAADSRLPSASAPHDLNLVTSPLFIEMLYGNEPIQQECIEKHNDRPLGVTAISEQELDSITGLLKSQYKRKTIKPALKQLFTPTQQQRDLLSPATVKKSNLVDLMRKEVDFRRQIDNLNDKLSSKKTTRKSALQIKQRISTLVQRLNETVAASVNMRNCTEEQDRIAKIKQIQSSDPVGALIERAKEASSSIHTPKSDINLSSTGEHPCGSNSGSGRGSHSDDSGSITVAETAGSTCTQTQTRAKGGKRTVEDETMENTSSSQNKQPGASPTAAPIGTDQIDGDVVIRGTEVIRRLLADVRGSRRQPEETWERIILAERMRRSLKTIGHYSSIEFGEKDENRNEPDNPQGISTPPLSQAPKENVLSYEPVLKQYVDYINQMYPKPRLGTT